ncbi:MAG TPA: hypothetical protein VMD99_03440 [Terriglobales bacterium]|nr:hypothetical protein [Terriglobales bacterium]
MILLQSQDSFDKMALLDGPGGNLHWIEKQNAPRQRLQGHFSQLGNSTLLFYRNNDGSLHFRIDERDIDLSNDIVVIWSPGLATNLSVVESGKPVLTFQYRSIQLEPPLELDPTPMVEMEDYDFGLFVANVTQDPERRARIYPLTEE